MRTILIIGIGTGDPDQITVQAIKALNRADVLFIPDKGEDKSDLRRLRSEICDRHVERTDQRVVTVPIPVRQEAGDGYRGSVARWHAALAERYAALFRDELGDHGCGALLVWGDPGLYDSTLRLIERIKAMGVALDHEVIPGITSVQALTARHKIPLNRIGEPVMITTGRKLAEAPQSSLDSIVMLDGEQAFARIEPQDREIYWGAYLGTEDEILIGGPLAEVRDEILRRRAEARSRKGWIMDTYLLRRRGD
jgi:precorrin-6A synthase